MFVPNNDSSRPLTTRGRFAQPPGLTQLEVLALISVGLLLVVAGGWFFRKLPMLPHGFSPGTPPPPPLTMGSPMQTVALPDGGSLLIDGIAESKLSFGTLSLPSGFMGSSGSRGRAWGGSDNKTEADTKEAEGKVIGIAFSPRPAPWWWLAGFARPTVRRWR